MVTRQEIMDALSLLRDCPWVVRRMCHECDDRSKCQDANKVINALQRGEKIDDD